MRRPIRQALALAALAALALTACQRSADPTPGEVVLGASVERARGHLAVALENAQAGAWDLAATHAAHPAEELPTLERMLANKSAAKASELHAVVGDAAAAAQGHDVARLRTAVERADRALADVPALVIGTRAGEPRYVASVVATLVETAADEYGEGVSGGRVTQLAEYQDAYAFLGRALALWTGVDAAVAAADAEKHDDVARQLAALRAAMPAAAGPTSPVDPEQVDAVAHDVQRDLLGAMGAKRAAAQAGAADVKTALEQLSATSAAIRSGDRVAALSSWTAFRSSWVKIEDGVRGRDRDAYRALETDIAALTTLLAAPSVEAAAADAVAVRIGATLAPIASSTATYGPLDAAIILLREGLEALLVVAALLAFLVKSGNADKRAWVWVGGGAGVAASVAVALAVSAIVAASSSAGVDPELLEGVTGVFAAAMLVYMSFWLHSRSSLRSWERWIRERGTAALARNSLVSIATLSFLAVFREGSETVLFYLGLAPSIGLGDLLLGLGAGAAGLVVVGALVVAFGVRIPTRPFFIVASVLVYYLAFKFLGSGIHSLQVAEILPASPAPGLPDIGALGVFPTWQTNVAQVALLGVTAAVLALERTRIARGSRAIA